MSSSGTTSPTPTVQPGKLGLKMGDMIPTLVKAIQEQQAIIATLEARLAALENK